MLARWLVLVALARSARGYAGLQGVRVARVGRPGATVDLGEELRAAATSQPALCILGTYAADFNCVEYAQRVAHYLPKLRERNVGRVLFVVNGKPEAATALAELVNLPADVELFADPGGVAGRAFGVSRGWRPDDAELSSYVKLFAMLFGLGAWATLPAVIGGYLGNPFVPQPWIESALAQGQRAGRWPNTALVLDEATGAVVENKFAALPLVGGWPRRPLELATLRLQNMLDISIRNWQALRPEDGHLRVLTQLGGCVVLGADGVPLYEHRDPGICAVCNFESLLSQLERKSARKL
ncbi:hypothetical protein KFE25_006766 [Diacronema lutheri]|uniref:Thioredoxin-like fold domain-containing protein n=1 Tax=Diacronema lutheri TaxID=2081491 RepID=A0A8J5XPK5_DIALT|nr:hypothetical protein KFE25_006766 [Diacronema lutheri]